MPGWFTGWMDKLLFIKKWFHHLISSKTTKLTFLHNSASMVAYRRLLLFIAYISVQ